MPGRVPGIHVLAVLHRKTWMAGTSPAMTELRLAGEFEDAGGPKRMRIEGADFGHPANVQRHHQPVAGDG
jgi:hypothetical protein